jgi:hypothetical protein
LPEADALPLELCLAWDWVLYTPVISALRRQKQEAHELKVSLGSAISPLSKK